MRRIATTWMGLAIVSGIGCGREPRGDDEGDGDADADTDTDADTDADADADADADGDCPAPGEARVYDLGVGSVIEAAGGDLDGDGRADLVVVPSDAGVASFVTSACGEPIASGTALAGVAVTGVAVGDLDGAGGLDVAALGDDLELSALGGPALDPLWSDSVADLSSAGVVVALHLDTDPDHDVAVFDAAFANLLRVENDGSGWTVRVQVQLPPGIEAAAAGDLGGNLRDEVLFLGGGLVEVVSVADFDFSDIRPLSGGATQAAAFADFSGDGVGDALVAADRSLELWTADAGGTVSFDTSAELDDVVVDVAANEGGAVAIVGSSGLVAVDDDLAVADAVDPGPNAVRVVGFGARAIAVTSAGEAIVWRR